MFRFLKKLGKTLAVGAVLAGATVVQQKAENGVFPDGHVVAVAGIGGAAAALLRSTWSEPDKNPDTATGKGTSDAG